MKATYKLELEQQQRRLGLTHKQLNRYDRKHNDHNLIKYLQSLEIEKKAASAVPATGFYGTLDITNEKAPGSQKKDIYARLYYDNNPLTDEITIVHPHIGQLEVVLAARLPNPSSTLVLRLRFEAGISSINPDAWLGFTPGNFTGNPLTQNNYLDMVVDSGFINGGALTLLIITDTP
jgi:hypothetical protein